MRRDGSGRRAGGERVKSEEREEKARARERKRREEIEKARGTWVRWVLVGR